MQEFFIEKKCWESKPSFNVTCCASMVDVCICMDATHGTNVWFDFGEGLPVAWAISNREDATMLVEFLEAIKYRTGLLKPPRWFISDDAEQYYNSWKCVFGVKGTSELSCAWHVDRSWRNSLKEHVHTAQARLEIYHHLRVLLMENEESAFRDNYATATPLLPWQWREGLLCLFQG